MLNGRLYKRYLAQLLAMMSQIYSFADSWHPLLKVNWAVLTSSFQFWSVMTGQIILSWHHQVFYLKFTKLNKVIKGNNHELCQSMSQSYWHVCWRSEWNVVWVDMKISCYSPRMSFYGNTGLLDYTHYAPATGNRKTIANPTAQRGGVIRCKWWKQLLIW